MARRPRPTLPPSRPAIDFWRDAALPMIEGRRAIGSFACYRAHTHPTLSIGSVDAGESTFRSAGRATRLRAGSVVIVAPGQVHACNPRRDRPWSYRMFHLDADWSRALLAGPPAAAWPQAVLSSPAAVALVDRLERALRSHGCADRRQADIARSVQRLFRLGAAASTVREISADLTLAAARAHLDAHCCESVTVAQLARLVRQSPFQLIRRFKREFGLTPHAYQLDRRINRTRDLLRRGHTLADIAYTAGFNDQSHFQRVFKSRVAATPAEYRGRTPLRLTPRRSR